MLEHYRPYPARPREGLRVVILLGLLLGGVTLLVICSYQLEPELTQKLSGRADRRSVRAPGEPPPLLLEAEDMPLLSQAKPVASVRRRPSRFSKGIWRRVQAMESDLITLRRKVHQFPELGNRESKTSALIATSLRRLGIEVRTGLAGTGVVALIRGARPGPVVAARAAMDGVAVAEKSGLEFASTERALYLNKLVPVSHAAGHDLELVVLLGAAEILADLRKELPGTVKLIFQPAAEGYPAGERGGARALIADGVLAAPSVSALYSLSVQPALRVTEVAVDTAAHGGGVARFEVLLASPSGGACRRPGPRCPDLISAASALVLNLRNIPHTRMDAAGRLLITIGAIHGGRSGEMLPARLTIKGTIRWRRVVDRNIAMHLVRRSVRASASLAGARSLVSFKHGGVLIGNNPRLARWSLGTLVRVLRRSRIRISSVPPVVDPDFDRFRRRVPAVLIQLGVGQRGIKATRVRTPEFVASESAIAVGVNVLSNLLVDYLLDASGDLRRLRETKGKGRPRRAPSR